jgi:hypothetical protein
LSTRHVKTKRRRLVVEAHRCFIFGLFNTFKHRLKRVLGAENGDESDKAKSAVLGSLSHLTFASSIAVGDGGLSTVKE